MSEPKSGESRFTFGRSAWQGTLTPNFGFKNIESAGWSTRSVLLLITFLLLTSTVWAGQSQFQVTAAELQRRGDLVGAESALQSALREARAGGPRSVKVAGALAALGVFYQNVGRFTQAESSFTGSLKILRETVGPEDLALAPLIAHLTWIYVETGRTGEASRLHPESGSIASCCSTQNPSICPSCWRPWED